MQKLTRQSGGRRDSGWKISLKESSEAEERAQCVRGSEVSVYLGQRMGVIIVPNTVGDAGRDLILTELCGCDKKFVF